MGILQKWQSLKHILWAVAIGLTASFVALAISQIQLFDTWELKTYDLRMVLTRGRRLVPEKVALFYVDEPSLRYMEGQGISWPWPRELYASALDFCRQGGARAVVFDLFYSEDSVYGVEDDEAFAAGVKDGPPTYFVLFLSGSDAPEDPRLAEIINKSAVPFSSGLPPWVPVERSIISLPIRPLIGAAAGFGNAQVPPDADGVYRRIDLLENYDGTAIPSIALKVAGDLRHIKDISWPVRNRFFFGDVAVPLDNNGRMMANYYGGTDTFPVYSLAEILVSAAQLKGGRKADLDPAVVKDKVVIVGVAAPGLYDMKTSPFSHVYPGPEVHATAIENLLRGDFLSPIGRPAAIFLLFLLGLVTAVGLFRISSSWGVVIWLSGLSTLIIGSGFYLFSRGVWMPIVAPFGAFALSAFAMVIYKFLTEGRKKREIRRAFKQYLSPEVVNQIAENPAGLKLGGIEKNITIFFSDIADFTSVSEKMKPSDLVEELNLYFSGVTRIIQASGGTLDKYIGDAVMAFWGEPLEVPDHAARAVKASLEIQEALKGGSRFTTRIGIHTNPAVVGNIGSDIRFNYTAIGDAVNLASRLEGLNKKFGTRITISETTYEEAKDSIEARRIGRVRVKGRERPIGIFEPLGCKGSFGSFGAEFVARFHDALELFERARFAEAGEIFDVLNSELDDPVSRNYKERCAEYVSDPPAGFDGVITFKTK